eukprot:COSAG02_NODE_229_length_28128_cov_18.529131_18_plen_54_part_00
MVVGFEPLRKLLCLDVASKRGASGSRRIRNNDKEVNQTALSCNNAQTSPHTVF